LKRPLILTVIAILCAANSAAQSFNIASSLKQHIEYLCCYDLQGRKVGSEGEFEAAHYVYDRLKEAGVTMLSDRNGQDFTVTRDTDSIHSLNIVGIVEGSDPSLRNEYIVVGAHYDNLGADEMTVNGEKIYRVYPGADDNASGVALMLELAKAVSLNRWLFPRSLIFVGFGAQSLGMAGSWYFANRAFDDMAHVKAMVDLDMLGRGNEANPFQIFTQSSQEALLQLMKLTESDPVYTKPTVASGVITPSDYLPFYELKIPVVLFTTGMTRECHTVKDSPSLILYGKMELSCSYIFYFLRNLSAQEKVLEVTNNNTGRTSETIYSPADCDKRPEFFHSDETHFLQSWVYKYLRYPESAVREGISGRVLVSLIVEKDGSVTNVAIEKGVDELLDDEVLRVVSISPKWIPGEVGDKKVRVKIVIPVDFKLSSGPSIRLKTGSK